MDRLFIYRVGSTWAIHLYGDCSSRILMDACDTCGLPRLVSLVYLIIFDLDLVGNILGLYNAFNHLCSAIIADIFYRDGDAYEWHRSSGYS